MKIITKTYILVGILIAIAGINLSILYGVEQAKTIDSRSIIHATDLKALTVDISSLAADIANGDEEAQTLIANDIQNFENILENLENGGVINDDQISQIPNEISSEFGMLQGTWRGFLKDVNQVKESSVFDQEVVNAINYILERNDELILLTNGVREQTQVLGRDYNRHNEIAESMVEHAEDFSQQALLLSVGEEAALEELRKARIGFEVDFRKLTGQSTADLPILDDDHGPEQIAPIPRENGKELRDLEPLWEAIQLRLLTLEDRSLLSSEFQLAKNNLQQSENELLSEVDLLLISWDNQLKAEQGNEQMIVQVLLVVDVIVFGTVIIIMRQSLIPLEVISKALSRVKEGFYGEKISYKKKDEVGDLVTSFNIMSDTIKQKEEDAKKNDIAKDEFLAMITHELKTPLVPIQGYADLLLSEHLGELTDKQKERLSIIKSSATSLLDIISDLLDAQKLELGQLKIKKESSSIKQTVEKAINSMQPAADESQVKLAMNCPDVVVLHDSERIVQVLTNLIKNSLKAVNQKTGAIQINVGDSPDEVKISVNDNGEGIPEDKQKDLFKKFYQVDASLTRERGGSGLGLAICKGIIEHHGGRVGVRSTPNVGTTITFTIPKQK